MAQSTEAASVEALTVAEANLAAERSRQDTLQSNPIMQDANRLEAAERDVKRREQSVKVHQEAHAQAEARLQREARLTMQSAEFAEEAERALMALRDECTVAAETAGISAAYAESPLIALPCAALADLSTREFDGAQRVLRDAIGNRREELETVKRRHIEVQTAQLALGQLLDVQRERQAELEDALVQRGEADLAFQNEGEALVAAWSDHTDGLLHLRFDAEEALRDLSQWATSPSGENPARQALQKALQRWQFEYTARQVNLDSRRETLTQERKTLEEERIDLVAGRSAVPAPPHTRGTDTRGALAGAPSGNWSTFARKSMKPGEQD